MRSLNLDQLRALVDVVERGSFSAAARHLNLTQPAISLQIRELERRFGVRLIERLGKQAHATAPGRTLVEAAQRIFHECDLVDTAMQRFCAGWIGRVHIGTTLSAMTYRLPPILRRLRLDYPGIDLVVTNTPSPKSVENVLQNKIDLALVNLPLEEKQLNITPLCAESLVAIFPAGTGGVPEEVTPDYVARQALLVEQPSSAAYPLVLGWLSGQSPARPPMPLGTIEALKSAVASSLGMAIVPEVAERHAHVRFHRAAAAATAHAHARPDRAPQQAQRASARNRTQRPAGAAVGRGHRAQGKQQGSQQGRQIAARKIRPARPRHVNAAVTSGGCQTNPATQLVAISVISAVSDPVIYLSTAGPADYRIFVQSRTFSARDAAALIVGARGGHHRIQAASL